MIAEKKENILFHVIGILVFISLPTLFISNGPNNTSLVKLISNYSFWFFCITYILVFYCNAYFLFPQLYLKKKHIAYLGFITALLLLIFFTKPFDNIIRISPPPDKIFFNEGKPQPLPQNIHIDFVSIILFLFVIGLSIIIPVVKQWQHTRQKYYEAQKDKALAELSFLKAQINPHFLFNTLNNLYSLALTQSPKTPDAILRLSNIMRYVTDEIQNDFVPISNEVECITDFIELQKLRLNNKTKLQLTTDIKNENLQIAPLLFLPFVENIFKHGISNNEDSEVLISISTHDKTIFFSCSNTKFNHTKNEIRQGTGIGNVKKRLENIYTERHSLKIDDSFGIFKVDLSITT